ncbi:excinuclease UvrABC ATPase subunit [Streptomyces africanus]|uniref:Excinuclease UvrABC ATPase subunit n=1 Tax=Streptomyces africanus TaxID=231024 RepID=A0ABU0QM30_9ACTN|nr:excinuclease UvrABC ATPase subunit [Streptomyces africanus]
MNGLLLQLRDKGNTVLVVEHKLGPRAGEVVFEGTVQGLRRSGTLTGRHRTTGPC